MTSDLWMCECANFYTGDDYATVYTYEPGEGLCHRMGGCGWIVAVKRGFKDEARVRLLGVEAWAREERGSYDNRYIAAHLREVQLYVQQALVQLEYAELAETDKKRGGTPPKYTCRTCGGEWQNCDCAQ